MAKRPAKKPVSLAQPDFPWEAAPRTRRSVVLDEIDLGPVIAADGTLAVDEKGDLVRRRARVWRTALPLALKLLPPDGRAAMLDYAAAYEAVGASGGTCDPTGGGGGVPGSRSPSFARLVAVERLRRMDDALNGGSLVLCGPSPRRRSDREGLVAVPYRDLAIWASVEGLTRPKMLSRAGVSGDAAADALTVALVDCAGRLAVCCGYVAQPSAGKGRATRRG